MGQWSELSTDLLETIEQLLPLYIDKVRVRAVCTSWNFYLPKLPNHQLRRLPWLLQSFNNNTDASHELFDLYDKKLYNLNLPELQRRLFVGSSHGWLVTVHDKSSKEYASLINSDNPQVDMYIFNPLTRCKIKLPHDVIGINDANRVQYLNSNVVINSTLMHKVVMSSVMPLSEDCFVVAIYGEHKQLVWCKSRDKEWKPLHSGAQVAFEDVIFYKGKLHALTARGEVLRCENICVDPKIKAVGRRRHSRALDYPMHLVESCDEELMMISRYVDIGGWDSTLALHTQRFEVYRVDPVNSSWVRVKDIGEQIFYVGLNSSFSISFPGYKGNSIYFTENPLDLKIEMRGKSVCSPISVFKLEDESFESLPELKSNPNLLCPPPIWVMPPVYYC